MSETMDLYFKGINEEVLKCYDIANKAKTLGFDPDSRVKIPLAKNMAERVEGLIASVAPEIVGKGVPERIQQLEEKFGSQDWRVALTIAEEVAKEKFCEFGTKKKAMEIGIRVGFAYVTVGVVASPLEGFVELKIMKRADGRGEYFCLMYGGPVRSAGGTGASVSVLIADHVRKTNGYDVYDASEKEIKRAYTELCDYHERVTNLQYFPSEDEVKFLMQHLPVQIGGDASEKFEVSNYKDLPRIDTNRIRNGFCLVMAECLCLKAPKVWKQLNKWGEEMGLDDWMFMKDFVDLQKEVKAKGGGVKVKSEEKIKPDFTFIKDLVAGRPVVTHPLRNGGWRLRYGRSRVSGFSGDAINPASMAVLDDFFAVGTQFKTERPGKSTTLGICDSINGPIVRLKNGDVKYLHTFEEAKAVAKDVDQIIYLGDILINYGDFLNRAHKLIPVGFVEEWWVKYLPENVVKDEYNITFDKAVELSRKYDVPLYPKFIFYWNSIGKDDFVKLFNVLKNSVIEDKKIIISDFSVKESLELIGCDHQCVSNEYLVVGGDDVKALKLNLGDFGELIVKDSPLEMVNGLCEFVVKDKLGHFIGARMGRPEKAKMRKLLGSPHVLFPIGEEGGRLRCFQSALEVGKVTSDFPKFVCGCGNETIYGVCEKCGEKAKRKYYCRGCKEGTDQEICDEHGVTTKSFKQEIDIKHYFYKTLEKLGSRQYPNLIKGVRGLGSLEKIPEHLVKGILRAKHKVHVNKEGTVRFDMSELPMTHFKPKEVGTSIERLKELGYVKDIYGEELKDEDQILELRCQDVVLPACEEAIEDGADKVLFRVANFLDDLLVKLYKDKSYYNLKSKKDLAGHLIVAMSPHTSAGIVCRIIGFSKVQGLYAHPLLHSIMRRDCLHYSTYLPVRIGGFWRVEKIGKLVEGLNPVKGVDAFGTRAVKVRNYETIGFGNSVKINDFTKHTKNTMYLIKTECGREIRVTKNHKFYLKNKVKKTLDLKLGDKLIVPYSMKIREMLQDKLDLLDFFKDVKGLMVRGVGKFIFNFVKKSGGRSKFRENFNLSKSSLDNYLLRDSFPIGFVKKFLSFYGLSFDDLPRFLKLGVVRCRVSIPRFIPFNKDVLYLVGLYVAEGYSRSSKMLNQVEFSMSEKEIRERVGRIVKKYFGLNPSRITEERFIFSSRLFYSFFNKLGCGRIAKEKRIPFLIFNLSKKQLSWFLQGYFDGDGSVSYSDCRVTCDSVSDGLLQDLEFSLKRFGIFVKYYKYKKKPGQKVREFYIKKGKRVPEFEITKLLIGSSFYKKFYLEIGFRLKRKQKILKYLIENCNPYGMKLEFDDKNVYSRIISIEKVKSDVSYCLDVKGHKIVPNGILTGQCDGDEAGCMLLLDTLLNFSRKYLPNTRGVTQDAPLVLTSKLIPSEVDDMVFDMDIVDSYPLELYEAAEEYKNPWDVKIELLGDNLNKEKEYEGMMFTHHTSDINGGVRVSSYKILPSMREKVLGQMEVARKIRAVDTDDVARLIIERHFMRDIKGNLRKFSQQSFRCVACNEIHRRPPLAGKCINCNGKLVFTIAEGSVVKYLEPALDLAEKYNLPAYLKQTLLLVKDRIESVFGKDPEKQEGLNKWF